MSKRYIVKYKTKWTDIPRVYESYSLEEALCDFTATLLDPDVVGKITLTVKENK